MDRSGRGIFIMIEAERHDHKIKPDFSNVRTGTEETGPFPEPSIDLVVVGSLDAAPEQNREAFGEYIAGIVATEVRTAGYNGKYLLLDAATGSSPASVWEALPKTDVGSKHNLILMGHEAALGTADFDTARANTLTSLGHSVLPILSVREVSMQPDLAGNFIPMRLFDVKREDYPDGDEGDKAYWKAQDSAAEDSARLHTEIVRAVIARGDVASLGIYGIGKDGHIGEWQKKDMGLRSADDKKDGFVQPQESYSIEAGDFVWAEDNSGENNNLYWKRGLKRGQAYGRAEWQAGYSGQDVVMGLGLRDMLALDHVVLAFNDESKSFVFQLAMEGSLDGTITKGRKRIAQLHRDKGEGEGMWEEFANYGRVIEFDGLIEQGTVKSINEAIVETASWKKDKTERPEDLRCGLLYRAIYKALDKEGIKADSPYYKDMWRFTNKYIGKRSPLGQLIRMRALLGKQTTIVATPEVVRGTPYESLAA